MARDGYFRASEEERQNRPRKMTGNEHRVYRMKRNYGEEVRWVRWQMGQGNKKEVDSIVHRYGREIGFRCANDGAVDPGDERMRASRMRRGQLVYKPKSKQNRCRAQSYLECYALKHHPNNPYSVFLNALKSELPDQQGENYISPYQETRELMSPSSHLLICFVQHLRDGEDLTAMRVPNVVAVPGRMNKGSTIELRIKSLSGVLKEFGQPRLVRTPELQAYFANWAIADDRCPAVAFHFEEVLPLLWDALWSEQFNESHKKKVETWARLLLQLTVIGRSSDVSEYCPENWSVAFPSNEAHYTLDGMPLWIEVKWLDWKGRNLAKNSEPYSIRVIANPKDLRFCPVHWLIEHWSLRGRAEHDEHSTIVAKISSENWRKKLTRLFKIIGRDGSSHSLRRAAAQWAARCGAGLNVIKNVGRWESTEHLLSYVAEGRMELEKQERDNDGIDPIFDFWGFSEDAMVSTIDSVNSHLLEYNGGRH